MGLDFVLQLAFAQLDLAIAVVFIGKFGQVGTC